MGFTLSRHLLGTESHLHVIDGAAGFQWTNQEIPPCLNGLNGDLDTAIRLERGTLPTPPTAYRNVVSCLGLDSKAVPWSKLLPTGRFREYVSSLLTTADGILNGRTWNYVVDTFQPQQRLLDCLQRPAVDVTELGRLYKATEGDTSTLDSFEADTSGFTDCVKYDRFKTTTGRLTVSSGPRILTLPKSSRGIIKSRWPDGRIVFVDYVSLEPRIALAIAGGDPKRDIYAQIERDLGLNLSRSVLKRAVLSILYGAGTARISDLTGLSKSEAHGLSYQLKQFFCVKRITDKVMDTVVDGYMRNYYGRPIFAGGKASSIIYNHYIQSTAADAALLGFASLLDSVEQTFESCVPLFVIHDCIVLDCAPDFNIEKCISAFGCIPGFENEFYVEVKHG